MRDRQFFAGVNSPNGFYSLFENIAPEKECRRKIYIKGGPGTGKSTVMKKIAERAFEEGYEAERFHCSSDSSSLDGVYIPKLKTAVVDATAPHGSDPCYVGVTGEIFDVSAFLNREKTEEAGDEIIHFTEHKKRAFDKACRFLRAASCVIGDIEKMYKDVMYMHGADIEAGKAIARFLPEITMPKAGRERKLFLSAVCPDGFVNFADNDLRGHIVAVKGGCGTSEMLKKIKDTALTRGFNVESFYCPLFPGEKLEHIIIKDINTVFTTYNHYHHAKSSETVDLYEYLSEMPAMEDREWSIAETLLKQAVNALADARAAHGFLESFYTPAMDFDALAEAEEKLEENIFNY